MNKIQNLHTKLQGENGEAVKKHLKDCVFCHKGMKTAFVDHIRVGNLEREIDQITTSTIKATLEWVREIIEESSNETLWGTMKATKL